MDRLYILCIEDQPEVLRAISSDLRPLENVSRIEECESAEEAAGVVEDIDRAGDHVAVVVSDHVMPERTGVDFLIELHHDVRFKNTRKILLTGLATHQDTIRAINRADIDRYIEKPWQPEQLRQYVRELLTLYVLDAGLDYQRYLPVLDQPTLLGELRRKG